MTEPVFSMGIDTRRGKQKKQELRKRQKRQELRKRQKRQELRKRQKRTLMGGIGKLYKNEYTFSLSTPTHFYYIPDIPEQYKNVMLCFLSLSDSKSLDSVDTYFSKNDVWCSQKRNVKKWSEINYKRQWLFRILYNHYLYFKMRGRIINMVDPSTLCVIKNRVLVTDMKQRGYYQFEAKSLQRQFDLAIGYNDWLFPKPGELKNPLTNETFTYAQSFEIIRQLRIFQCTSWLIEAYASIGFQKIKMRTYYKAPLSIYGVHEIIRNPTSEITLDLLKDFIYEEFVANNASVRKRRIIPSLVWAIEYKSSHPYIVEWLNYYKDFQIYDIVSEGISGCPIQKRKLDLKGFTLFIDDESQTDIWILWSQNR